jgi:hypothetical protein
MTGDGVLVRLEISEFTCADCRNKSINHIEHDCSFKLHTHMIYNSGQKSPSHTSYFPLSWVFYHDALKLMLAKETVDWMKEKGCHKQWLLPVMGLHSDDPDLKAYLETIPGSGPENMPWDLSLNIDAHEDTKRHVVLTHELANEDPKKFDLSTKREGLGHTNESFKFVLAVNEASRIF